MIIDNLHMLDRQLTNLLTDSDRPLASLVCVVLKNREPVWHFAGGRRRIDEQNPANDLPVTLETGFRIASISKLLTTIGFLRLVERQKIGLDDDCRAGLGFELRHPNFPNQEITPRMLLSHNSSLRDGRAYTLPLPHRIEECFNPLLNSPFYEDGGHWGEDPPGRFFSYCNLNFGVIATIIERLTSRRFDLYMKEEVLNPLGISGRFNVVDLEPEAFRNLGTVYRRTADPRSGRLRWMAQIDGFGGRQPGRLPPVENPDVQAAGRQVEGAEYEPDVATYVVGSNGTRFSPQGGLRVSAADLIKVAQLLFNEGRPLLKPSTLKDMVGEQWCWVEGKVNGDTHDGLMRSWGLSVHRFTHTGEAGDGDKLHPEKAWRPVGHLGEAYGLLSGLLVNLESGDGVIYVIGGTSVPLEEAPGTFSSFTSWEETILSGVIEAFNFR
ncbi:MAG: serine hydrolase [Ardenticatenaceae bacterium]|nr:serine hydrolase [Ardenticatenaceae bacterium]